MPGFSSSPFVLVPALVPQTPAYSLGSFDSHNPGTKMAISSVAITTNVATLAVKILEGPIPVANSALVGSLISVQGTQTVTSGGGVNFNVNRVALTGVTIDSITGIGTVTFALTSSNIATTVDAGVAIVPSPIKFDVISPSSTSAGSAFAIVKPSMAGLTNLRAQIQFSGAPGAFEVDIQGSDTRDAASFVNITSVTAVNSGNYAEQDLQVLSSFIRAAVPTFANSASVNLNVSFTQK